MRSVSIVVALLLLWGCSGMEVGPVHSGYDVFKRRDGITVQCDRLPPDVMNKSTKGTVDIAVSNIGQLVKGSAGVEIDPQQWFKTSPTIADYRAVQRSLCVDYANEAFTPEQYRQIREKYLPALRNAIPNALIESDVLKSDIIKYEDKKRVAITFRIRPITRDNQDVAHVIYMLAIAHTEDQLPAGHAPQASSRTCKEVASCIAFRLWNQSQNPLIVRGDDVGTTLTWTVDASNTIKALRIYWEVYQREHDQGAQCVEDKSRQAPSGGIPFLKVVDEKGSTVPGRLCYMTYGDSLVKL
jgi:hypothetical protein